MVFSFLVLLPQSFPYENHCECYKKLVSRWWPVLFTLTYFFLTHTHSCSAAKWKFLVQVFTDCVHGYNHERYVHASDVTCTRKSVHSIHSSMLKLFEFANLSINNWELLLTRPYRPLWFKKIRKITRPLWFNKIRKTTTTAFLMSNTVVPNPYSHSIAFDSQSFALLL